MQKNNKVPFLKPLVCILVCSDELQWIEHGLNMEKTNKQAHTPTQQHKKKLLNCPIFILLSLISVML